MTAVLLTGGRAPATLDLARRFAELGVTVIAADSQPTITAASRAVTRAYRVPSPRFRPHDFASAVTGIARRHAVDLVVPTCEETFWLALAAADPEHAELARLLFAPTPEVLRRLHDKVAFTELLAELRIPHPETVVIASQTEWRRHAASRDRARRRHPDAVPRSVAKPAFSRFGTRTLVIGPREPLPAAPRITADQPWLLQEHIDGTEFCTYAVAVGGRITAFVAYRPIWRAGRGGERGAGVAFERLSPSAPQVLEALRIASAVAGAVGLTGQFGLDLMHRTASPDAPVVVLECNPRATSGIHLFAPADGLAAAFPLPHPTSGALRSTDPSRHPLGTRAWAPPAAAPDDAFADAGPADGSAADSATADSATAASASRPSARLGIPHVLYAAPALTSARLAREFARQLSSPDALRPAADRLPLSALIRSLLVQARTARAAGIDLLAASTHDLEWNGQPLPPRRGAVAPSAHPQTATRPPDWAARFVEAVTEAGGTAAVIPNAHARFELVTAGAHELPVTVSSHDAHRGQSYIVSPFTHYVEYAREELAQLPSRVVRRAGTGLLAALGAVLEAGRVDDVVMVGNGLVSTNLLPPLSEREVAAVTEQLRRTHPDRAVAWRSVHGRDTELPDALRRCGYRLLPSRSVLFVPTRGTGWLALPDVRRDRRLFEESDYEAVPAPVDPATGSSDDATLERLARLYAQLYLDKYSRLNPAYTPAFLRAAQRSGFLEFTLLRRRGTRDPKAIDGVLGTSTAHGFVAAPVFGYDTALPVETGLYRMLSWLVAREAHLSGSELHASSGVADFKRHRGGEPELEYTAVYTKHLPPRRRAAWAVLEQVLTRIALPLVQRNGL